MSITGLLILCANLLPQDVDFVPYLTKVGEAMQHLEMKPLRTHHFNFTIQGGIMPLML